MKNLQRTKTAQEIETIKQFSLNLLRLHLVKQYEDEFERKEFSGQFSLLPNQADHDLYGMIDCAYILHILNLLEEYTTENSREQWASQIVACQDETGWFTKRNERGHSKEHATAYAMGALKLLSVNEAEKYVAQIKPIPSILPLLNNEQAFTHWISRLGLEYNIKKILQKNVGWNHVWRSSHIGGGVPAIIGMAQNELPQWWPNEPIDVDRWFSWYFSWLDDNINPKTGLWQLALWNIFYKTPTIIDMGGAVHFYWIYDWCNHPYPYPAELIDSTISLQLDTGLYKSYPYCIDLDGNYCIIRSFNQLEVGKQDAYREKVSQSLEANFEAILAELTTKSPAEVYNDSHGLPGALAALVECRNFPNFKYSDVVANWQNSFDTAWWL